MDSFEEIKTHLADEFAVSLITSHGVRVVFDGELWWDVGADDDDLDRAVAYLTARRIIEVDGSFVRFNGDGSAYQFSLTARGAQIEERGFESPYISTKRKPDRTAERVIGWIIVFIALLTWCSVTMEVVV